MKFMKFIFALGLSLLSLNAFAGSVACGSSSENMVKAVNDLNYYLSQRLGWELSRPVLHESTSSDGTKRYLACVSLIK